MYFPVDRRLFSVLVTGVIMLLFHGCMNGVYTVDSKLDYDQIVKGMNYELLVDAEEPFKDRVFSEDTIPIIVREQRANGSHARQEHPVLDPLFWLTLGVVPNYGSARDVYNISVVSPIGVREASYAVNARDWTGWIPCVIPIPGWGVERIYGGQTTLSGRCRIAAEVRDKVVKVLVGQFSKEEYTAFVKKMDAQRAAEKRRVDQRILELNGLLSSGRFEECISGYRQEMKNTGKTSPWESLLEEAMITLRQKVPGMDDSKRLAEMFGMFDDWETKITIVSRLAALKQINLLPSGTLTNMVEMVMQLDMKISLIQEIDDNDALLMIANKKYGIDVTIAALKKIGNADLVRKAVWAELEKEVNEELLAAYLVTFGTDAELDKLVDSYSDQINIYVKCRTLRMHPEDGNYSLAASRLTKAYELIKSKEQAERERQKRAKFIQTEFNGIFGKKFGTTVPVRRNQMVRKYGMDFYRVPFSPREQSTAFNEYYVWCMAKSHRIFAIEARSDTALPGLPKPSLVTSLEAKYQCEFNKQGEGFVAYSINPEGRSLFIVADLIDKIENARIVGSFTDALFGNLRSFESRLDEMSKIDDLKRKYRFKFGTFDNDEDTRAIVLAKDWKLFKAARSESEQFRRNGADAF